MWVGYNYSWSRRGLLACTHTSLTCFVKPAGGMTKLDLSYISFGNINQVFFFFFPPDRSKHTPLVRHGSAIATDELTVNNGFIYSPQTTCDVRNVCTTPPSLEVTHERHLNVLWQEKKRGLSTTKHSRCEFFRQLFDTQQKMTKGHRFPILEM